MFGHDSLPNEPSQYEMSFDALPAREWPLQWQPTPEYPAPQDHTKDEFSRSVDETMSFRPALSQYRLGIPDLPIAPYREYLQDTLVQNQSLVLSSETGSGKTSQLGLYMLEDPRLGESRIFVSSPRIMAAREHMEWARRTVGPEYEKLVGYMTGTAKDSDVPDEARLIFVTEQLLFKLANRGELGPKDIVVNDEAHERNVPTEFLQGIVLEVMDDNPDVKLLVCSATMDTQAQAAHLAHPKTQKPAPIIELPGRTYPITDLFTDRSMAEVVREYMDYYNVLAFEPGLTRQMATRQKMSRPGGEHTVHLLHADLSPTEQKIALTPGDGNHIVSNRTGETSITPAQKDAVVDSGLSNIGIYRQGVRTLKTVFSSQATMMQRRGRVGRTAPGVYVSAAPENAPFMPFEERDKYDIPPIEISTVASYIAELLATGRSVEDMRLLNRPTTENLQHDYRVLRRLGAIMSHEGRPILTETGRAMTDLPLDIQFARMLVAAREVPSGPDVDTEQVRLQVAAATAVRQVSGILNAWGYSRRRYLMSSGHEDNISNEKMSDFLFELDVFIRMSDKLKELEAAEPETAEAKMEAYLHSKDVFVKRFYKAQRTFEELCRREDIDWRALRAPTAAERTAVLGCQITGADELFVKRSRYTHVDVRGDKRRLGRKSTIDHSLARLVVGTPFDLVGMRDTGHFSRAFIVGGSAVTSRQVREYAAHRVTSKSLGLAVTKEGDIVDKRAQYFDGEIWFDDTLESPEPTFDTREFIIRAMLTGIAVMAQDQTQTTNFAPPGPNTQRAQRIWTRAQELEHKSSVDLKTVERLGKLIRKITQESASSLPLDVVSPAELDALIPRIYLQSLVRPSRKKDVPRILAESPDAVVVSVEDESKRYLPVLYRHNIAYVTIPKELVYMITEADIESISKFHPVKMRIEKGHYYQADVMFQKIEERRNSPQRLERLKRRAEAAERKANEESDGRVLKLTRNQSSRKQSVPKVLVSRPVRPRRRVPRGRNSEPKKEKQIIE